MDCWTLRGILNLSRSLLLAAASALIKVYGLLSVQHGVVEVLGDEAPPSGAKQLGLEEGPGELLQGQAVIAEEPGHGHGRGGQDADPACGLLAEYGTQAQVDGHGDPHGSHGAEELPGGETEEDGLLVLADFFGNFDFHILIFSPKCDIFVKDFIKF